VPQTGSSPGRPHLWPPRHGVTPSLARPPGPLPPSRRPLHHHGGPPQLGHGERRAAEALQAPPIPPPRRSCSACRRLSEAPLAVPQPARPALQPCSPALLQAPACLSFYRHCRHHPPCSAAPLIRHLHRVPCCRQLALPSTSHCRPCRPVCPPPKPAGIPAVNTASNAEAPAAKGSSLVEVGCWRVPAAAGAPAVGCCACRQSSAALWELTA
jgi:hypothetical protein